MTTEYKKVPLLTKEEWLTKHPESYKQAEELGLVEEVLTELNR